MTPRARLLADVHTFRGSIPAGTVVDVVGDSPEAALPELVIVEGDGITAIVDRATIEPVDTGDDR